METLNNVTNAAVKAVWGSNEAKQEPVSGVSGDTSKGEPYDAGNMDEPADSQGRTESAAFSSNAEPKTSAGPDVGSKPPSAPSELNPEGHGATEQNTENDPTTGENVKVDGPGPKPIAELAKEHGGDAGNSGKPENSHDNQSTGELGSLPENEGSSEKQHGGHEKGTGEEYVKSTGLRADGGDFDASKPGAGREADRLLEEKGVVKDDSPSRSPAPGRDHRATEEPAKEKQSLAQKIKAKLHVR